MDLGATVCRPVRPECPACPVRRWCAAATPTGPAVPAAAGDLTSPAPGRRARPRPVPFEQTTRWLRGRIVDRLRDAAGGGPVDLRGPLGTHSAAAVTAAVAALAPDGLVELDRGGRALGRHGGGT